VGLGSINLCEIIGVTAEMTVQLGSDVVGLRLKLEGKR